MFIRAGERIRDRKVRMMIDRWIAAVSYTHLDVYKRQVHQP